MPFRHPEKGSRLMQFRVRGARLAAALAVGLAFGGGMSARAQQDVGGDQTSYYLGEGRSGAAEGKLETNSVILMKRVLSPLRGTIEEHVLIAEKGAPVNETVWTYRILGSQALVEAKGSSAKGEGELTGKAWQWNAFRYTVRLPGKDGTVRA